MDETIAKLIKVMKKKRHASGYSLRKLASVIGVSFSTLARIERGDGLPDNNSRIRILEWLGDEANAAGLSFENIALVHFRARKNIDSKTVH
jgi:transcriptional regulator with XRE-family HTH domain